MCERLSDEAAERGLKASSLAGAAAKIEAAAASDRLEALEAALPGSVGELMDIIGIHARAGPQHRFATQQLLALTAQCVDLTDATARHAAATVLQEVLSTPPAAGQEVAAPERAWNAKLANLMVKVHASPADMADALLRAIGTLYAAAGGAEAGTAPAHWTCLLHVTALLLGQLPSARAAAAVTSEFTLLDIPHRIIEAGLGHGNEGVRQCNLVLSPALHCSVAPTPCMPGPWCAAMRKSIRALVPIPSSPPSHTLSHTLQVRREAVRCLGLYCMLDGIPTPIGPHVATLRALLASPTQPHSVRTVAAQVGKQLTGRVRGGSSTMRLDA